MAKQMEEILSAALRAVQQGDRVAIATIIEACGSTPRRAGAKMLIYANGRTIGTVGGGPLEAWVIEEAQQALDEEELRVLQRASDQVERNECGVGMRLLVEVLLPRPTLLVIGAGHIGEAVVAMSASLDYRIAVLDERPELVTQERLPEADMLLSGPFTETLKAVPLTEETYVVIVTPHQSRDEAVLSVVSQHPVPYVGLLGGRRRTAATLERARKRGVSEGFLEKVCTPIGLSIHAQTPSEIAVSILAEVIAVRRRGGQNMEAAA